MVAAIIASALVMTAEKINNLVTRYPGFKTLALLFLVLLGGLLMAEEGFAIHINKGYVYFAMAFGLVLELCHIQLKNKQRRTIQRIRPMHQPTVVYGAR
ncbi:tellurium resistance protein TerC [Vibrio parahaemolyticus]|nr:tellurium resistance protein TerC [Vibrio parahaemolyticus]HCM1571759.1 tellurium resistance protein TerC [Vibrio parahaemolyticus]